MFTNKTVIAIAAAALLAMPGAGMAQGKKGGDTTTTTVPVGSAKTAEALVARYTTLAGSQSNAQSLVTGLRDGSTVTLTGTILEQTQVPVETQITETVQVPIKMPAPPPALPGTFMTVYQTQTVTRTVTTYRTDTVTKPVIITIATPTGNMGLGNVDIALAFTEAQLAEVGITSPLPSDLNAALMGGNVVNPTTKTTKNLSGVLKLRAGGMGWGQIANQFGYKLQ